MKLLLHIKKEWLHLSLISLYHRFVVRNKKRTTMHARNIQKWNMMPTSIPKDLFLFHEKGIEALL
jgi:hypothetical protein